MAGGTSLDLSCAEPHHEVGNECVLSLPRAVAHHHSPAIRLSQFAGLDGFGHRTNLVDLQQQTVAGFLLNGLGNPLRVGDCEVISHDLDVHTQEEQGPMAQSSCSKGSSMETTG